LSARLFATRIGIWIVVVAFTWSPKAKSQVYSGPGNSHEVFVGTETESYLRYRDLSDTLSKQAWSIRPMSSGQVTGLAKGLGNHPWQARLAGFAASPSLFTFRFLSPNGSIRFNSQFPYGSNDGAIWAGRGVTMAAQGGLYVRIGPLSLTLLPTVFRAENGSFPLGESGLPCRCGEPIYDNAVDRPQRFGTVAYQRLDPGQSSVRLDVLGLTAGLSTANEGWGPSVEYPFVVGSNAAGFPHLFFGSSSPFPIFVGRAHLKVIYGRLDQSDYSPVTGPKFYASRLEPGRVRFASGVVATFQPRGFDGLEIGGSRFIQSIWPVSGIPSSYLRKPLQAFLKINQPGIDQQLAGTDNQVASLFARWAFRESGLEVYGEYGREDNSYDLRDFAQEPDHQRAYSVGFAKVFGKRSSQFSALRVEAMNFQLPPLATTGRGEGSIYIHSPLRQGHTNRGQLLGADIGVAAAAASTVRWDHYSGGGRWAVFWRRNVRRETGDPSLRSPSVTQISDVLHAFGYERLKFTRRFDITTSFIFMRDLSRNLSNSRSNLNAVVAITLPR
jgi:Capsule assembly protein Wzi